MYALVQPCFVFVGEGFESNPDLRMAKSLLLDFFRGRQIDAINLKVYSQTPDSSGDGIVLEHCLAGVTLIQPQPYIQPGLLISTNSIVTAGTKLLELHSACSGD